jgi:four helix bundle protein
MQIRRAAGSVPANISEGYGRRSPGDYLRHLRIATGSLQELETHLLLSERLDLLDPTALRHLLDLSGPVGRMLTVLLRRLAQAKRP